MNQGFSYYFCMLIEGSGSIPLTSGSGSGSHGRPKNMWIRWIRIRNTAQNVSVITTLCGAGCGVPRLHRPDPDAEPQAELHVQEQAHQDDKCEKGFPDQQRAVRR
jgi:hypothetical protein